MIQDGNCIGQYATNTKKHPERLQVIELHFAMVNVLEKRRGAANIPLIRYSAGRKSLLIASWAVVFTKLLYMGDGATPCPYPSCKDEEPCQVLPLQPELREIVVLILMHSETEC